MRGLKTFLGALVVVVAALAQVGCGYALVGRGSTLPEDVQAIYIAPFENRTPRSQVEQFVTAEIADELVTRQRFRVVASEAEADARLSGTVLAFNVTPVTFDADGRATEYEISLAAQVDFRRTGTEGEVLWSNDRYVFRSSYEVNASQAGYFDLEDSAIEETAERFAETMVADLLEGF